MTSNRYQDRAPRIRGGVSIGICLAIVWGAPICMGQTAEAAAVRGQDLRLPTARFAEPDEHAPKVRPVIDILQDGRVLCDGRVRYDPAKDVPYTRGVDALLAELKARPETTTTKEQIGDRELRLVDDPILIRADRCTEWHHVGQFMVRCSQPDAAFWKIELGVTTTDGEAGKVPSYLPRDRGGDVQPVQHLAVQVVCSERGRQVPREGQDEAKAGAAKQPYDLEGHEIVWQVGPKKLVTEAALLAELKRIARDRATWREDPATGNLVPMPVVIEPGQGATYGDVVRTLDAVHGAGFVAIAFGGGPGAGRR